MFYYVYKITNTINNKIYIGVHQTKNLDDNYFGSGLNINRAIKKYGKANFTKEILEFFNSEKDMHDKEKELVNTNFVNSKDTYNITEGGHGSFSYVNSLRNQGHRAGQQAEASMIRANKLKSDLAYKSQFSDTMKVAAKQRIDEGKMFFQQEGYINAATMRKWMSNDLDAKSLYVHIDQISSYTSNGWYLGRKYKKTSLGTKHKKRN